MFCSIESLDDAIDYANYESCTFDEGEGSLIAAIDFRNVFEVVEIFKDSDEDGEQVSLIHEMGLEFSVPEHCVRILDIPPTLKRKLKKLSKCFSI